MERIESFPLPNPADHARQAVTQAGPEKSGTVRVPAGQPL